MAVEVILPKVDMDMDTGSISKWHIKDGDTVKKGQAIFDIETDKSAMEIESPGDGVIRIGRNDTNVAINIGSIVAVIYASGETDNGFPTVFSAAPAAHSAQPLMLLEPEQNLGRHESASHDGKTRATPLARRLAKQNGIPLSGLIGSGPGGRIVAADVRNARTVKPTQASATVPAFGVSEGAAQIKALYEDGSYEVKPLDGMRRTIAQRLVQSKQTIPHFYLTATCTIDSLLAMRERLNVAAQAGAYKLSINDFVVKAYALALQRVPNANATYTDEGILLHTASDIGVAVSVEGGLFTPIIRGAEAKSLSVISSEVKTLAALARARKLQAPDYQGGSAAISNLGMYGVEQFTAIINPPHATILAVGATVERLVPVKELPVLMTQMTVTLSADHRAIDGAIGAQLLAAFKALMEDPALMLV
jgi:pyruvate dehydrogenase E2 component (dihydrolipoamide acetyltransferase)